MSNKTKYQNYTIQNIKKYSLLAIFSFVGLAIQAQIIIKGTVIDQNAKEPV